MAVCIESVNIILICHDAHIWTAECGYGDAQISLFFTAAMLLLANFTRHQVVL